MYWKYALKRILYGLIIYVILIFIFSALFNTTVEQTARTEIYEKMSSELSRVTQNMSPEQVEVYRTQYLERKFKEYNLDKPLFERIIWRTYNSVTFQYGNSTKIKTSQGEKEVIKIIGETIPKTLLLFLIAFGIEVIIGILVGIKKAQKAGGMMDKITSVATMIVYGMPSWWLGMILIMFFAYSIKLFPSGGVYSTPPMIGAMKILDVAYHLILPVFTLVILNFWGTAFVTRNIVLGTLQEDFVMSARARGIPENKVLFGHTMRTSAPPIVTMALLSLLSSVSGNILFEGIFSWPGMGNLYWIAIEQNDVPVLMGLLAITTALYIAGLVILDLIYGFLDPRIKVGGKA